MEYVRRYYDECAAAQSVCLLTLRFLQSANTPICGALGVFEYWASTR